MLPGWLAHATPVPLMLATVMTEEFQVTELVKFLLLPSLYFPVAVNCWLPPLLICALGGVTVMEVRVGAAGAGVPELEGL